MNKLILAQRSPNDDVPALGGGKTISLVDDPTQKAAQEAAESKRLADEKAAKDAAEAEKLKLEQEEAERKKAQNQNISDIDKLSDDDFIKSIENKSFSELTEEEKTSAKNRGIDLQEDDSQQEETVETLFKESLKLIDSNFDEKELAKYNLSTPEGVKELLLAQQDAALLSWEQDLAKRFPREYEALRLASRNEDPSILYKDNEVSSLIKMPLKDSTGKPLKENEKTVYRQFLKSTGTPEDDIDDLITLADDKGTLTTKAIDAQNKLKATEEQRIANIAKEREEKELYEQDIVQGFEKAIDNKLKTGKLGNINLPENLKVDFSKYLSSLDIEVKGDDLYISRKITPENLDSELQALYYSFAKGDLRKIAENIEKANKVIKLKADKNNTRNNSSGKEGEAKPVNKLAIPE